MHHKRDQFAYPGSVLNAPFPQRAALALWAVMGLVISVSCSVQTAGTPTESDLGITPTVAPTATAQPTATAAPTPSPTPMALSFDALFDKASKPEIVTGWELPIAHCLAVGAPDESRSSTQDDQEPDSKQRDEQADAAIAIVPRGVQAIRCIDGDAAERPTGIVQAVADARIVQIGHLGSSPEHLADLVTIEDASDPSVAQWVDGGLLGDHIVLDIDLPAQAEVDPTPVETAGEDADGDDASPERTEDPEIVDTEPEATQDTEPEATRDTEPEATQTTEPDATQTTEPDATQTTEPDATQTTEPKATQNTEPKATQTTEPDGSSTTEANNADSDDPGPADGAGATRSIQVVYGGLDADFRHLELGQRVKAGEILGNTAADGTLLFGVWVDGVRQDDATAIATKAPDRNQQLRAATRLAPLILPPTSPECGLVKSQGRIPGAPREYRHGYHQGIDFVCTGDGNEVTAVADGTVVYLVDDYQDATVKDRNALLSRAVPAGNTPYWTLAMLYGNVVVIDHGEIDGVGRVFTISAHLDSVEDDIRLGTTVKQDQVIGIVGTTGTNASADGLPNEDDPAQHLHWELFIDNWYLGQGLTPPEVQEIIVVAVCEDGSPDCDSAS